MTTALIAEGTRDVPTQVFQKFLQALGEAGAGVELVVRLQKTLIEERAFSERALKQAVLGEESQP